MAAVDHHAHHRYSHHQHQDPRAEIQMQPVPISLIPSNQTRQLPQFSPETPDSTYNPLPTEAFEMPPAKRQRTSVDGGNRKGKRSQSIKTSSATASTNPTPPPTAGLNEPRSRSSGSPPSVERSPVATRKPVPKSGPGRWGLAGDDVSANMATVAAAAVSKPRRVRTGCLTCRERHLKCDEATPDCMNCRKSNRECKRGVRLNFIDVQVKTPPHMPRTVEWSVRFEDESRAIASEYQGGLGRYPRLDDDSQIVTPSRETEVESAVDRDQHRDQQHSMGDSTDAVVAAIISDTTRAMPMSHFAAEPRHMSTDQGYGGNQLVPVQTQSRKNSESDVVLSGGLGADSVLAGLDPGVQGGNFSLASLQDQFSLRGDSGPRTHHSHAYKASDVSSVASSMLPQGLGPPSNSSVRALENTQLNELNPHAGLMTPPSEKVATTCERDYLNSPEELFFMQVFVDNVGVWMDSLDKDKHFSRVIPYLALKSPMLLNAFLACGVKHLTLVNPAYNDDKALFYYDTATTQLLRSLQNPDRNTGECATTAVVLNVYEIMSEKPIKRMSHIAGARALIRECGWNAKSTGVGHACFWLNIGMEVLSCLAFNWQTAWDPDQWGLDMSFLEELSGGDKDNNSGNLKNGSGGGVVGADGDGASGSGDKIGNNSGTSFGGGGDEEEWVHRIFYLVAKIANFRANIPTFREPSPHDEQARLQARFAEWKRLKALCDSWNNNCPRSMRPFGYLYASQTGTKSAFPNVWLIKRAAVVGRLFYHTAMCLLAQINPLSPRDSEDNVAAQQHHAHQVCGIVAHTRDKGVASVAIRSLAIASCVLTDRREQEEVVTILEKINRDAGWRLGKVFLELEKAWGWKIAPKSPSANPNQAQVQGQQSLNNPGLALGVGGNTNTNNPNNHTQSVPSTSALINENATVLVQAPPAPGPPLQLQPQPTTTGGTQSSVPNMAPGPSSMAPQFFSNQPAAVPSSASSVSSSSSSLSIRPPVNPLLVKADFSLPDHPYQNWYEPPNRTTQFNSHGFWTG